MFRKFLDKVFGVKVKALPITYQVQKPASQQLPSTITQHSHTPPPPRSLEISEETKTIIAAISQRKNILIHGGAGTGKTELFKTLRKHLNLCTITLAPTGMAALNAEGQTIHSFFKFPPKTITPNWINSREDIIANNLYRDIDIIMIDEISMVRCELLDAVDAMMRRFGRDSNKPFGGAQIILCGDHFQLPPVVKREDTRALNRLGYNKFYFWQANSFKSSQFVSFELTRCYRQTQPEFISALNSIRFGNYSDSILKLFNSRIIDRGGNTDVLKLVYKNQQARDINSTRLQLIPGRSETFEAILTGRFRQMKPEDMPFENVLELKIGAKVMMIKNIGSLVNGHIGAVLGIKNNSIIVNINGTAHTVHKSTWESYRYVRRNGEVTQEIDGTAEQFPLRLAWAVTVHKSQGQTYDEVFFDSNNQAAFASGQIYVALSRCKTLEGLKLSHAVFPNDFNIDPDIIHFHETLKDDPRNMQWQTKEEAKEKDKWE